MMPPAASPSDVREFVALTLPAPVRDELARLQENIPGIRWTPSAQFHITLRFLGGVPEGLRKEMDRRLSQVRVEPFILPVEGVGVFPPKGPAKVVWAGTGSSHPRLFQLRQQVDDALLGAGLDLDVRTFHAHVTLGRCEADAVKAVKAWALRHDRFVAAPFRVDAFSLYSSVLERDGPVHRLLRRFAL